MGKVEMKVVRNKRGYRRMNGFNHSFFSGSLWGPDESYHVVVEKRRIVSAVARFRNSVHK